MKEQGSLFDDTEIHHLPQSGTIALSNVLIRGGSTTKKRKVKRGDKVVYVSEATANDRKVEDTCIELLQAKQLREKINYSVLEKEAEKILEPEFQKFNLFISSENTKKKNKEIIEIRKIAVNDFIKKKVAEQLPTMISLPIKDFIKRTGITRIQNRFNEALKLISESSSKLDRSWVEQKIDFSGDEIKVDNQLIQGSIIPKFRLKFSNKLQKHLSLEEIRALTIEDFIDLDISNKISYVDELILEMDPETIVEIIGVGIFGGYARSKRENRNLFRRSLTFNLDFLVRSIINIPHNEHLTEYTFEELKKHLGGQRYTSWESFKKSVFLPALEDLEKNTEIECTYKLIPSQKNWTHIKLLPKYKINSMGFKAEKFGYDYLVYFIAVQHKFFQTNNLTESFDSFLSYVQSYFYSKQKNENIYGKTKDEWIEYGKKVYQAETELIQIIKDNDLILLNNNLIYDENRMCLVKKNLDEDEELEVTLFDNDGFEVSSKKKSKTSYLKTPVYKVTDPLTSLKYINELTEKNSVTDVHILDFIPFEFADVDLGWIPITNPIIYSEHVEQIKFAVYKKKSSYFKFDKNEKKEMFIYYLENERFKEIDQRYRELIGKLI